MSDRLDEGFARDQIEDSIVRRFESIVRRYPSHIALNDRGQTWTYHALNRTANRIAHAILTQTTIPEEPVPLFLGHTAPAIAAILGVLKACRPYCVLDPRHPRARLNQILQELGPQVVITDTAGASLVRELDGNAHRLIMTDGLDNDLPVDDPGVSVVSHAGAIFYTSGSTGRPKGVVHRQQTMLHRIWLETNASRFSPTARGSSLFSLSFGASVVDVFGPLLNGGSVCMYDLRTQGLDGLGDWLAKERLTFFHIPAAPLRQFLDSLSETPQFGAVRHFMPSGPIYRTELERFWGCFPNATLISHMGSSETQVIAQMDVTRETVFAGDVVPLGYPVPDKEVFILDEAGVPLPRGEIGEIGICSRFLFREYWRRPDLTDAAFLPDPNGGSHRLYRPGDLGRISLDGCLEYIGRRDHQIKIRGYRVEIGEVEAALHRHKGVKEAAVLARESRSGEKKLVAYVALRSDSLPADDLRSALTSELPDYMVPASFVVVQELPRTDNGKIDSARLPDPKRGRPLQSTPYSVPRNPLETHLAELWADLLDVESVGIHDNFLELGGHSLLAMQVRSRILMRYCVALPMQLLFATATVAAQAAAIAEGLAKSAKAASPAEAIPGGAVSGPCVLSFAQQRLWFLEQLEPESPLYNLPRAIHIRGKLDKNALHQALNAIVDRHHSLRTTFSVLDGTPVQAIAPSFNVDLRFLDLSAIPATGREAEIQRVSAEEARRPFDLSKDLMIRTLLLQMAADEHLLLFTRHHIASDAWSSQILFGELASFYSGFCGGEPFQIPGLPIQYVHYAIWQRRRFEGGSFGPELAYWKRQLEPLPAMVELPADRPRPAMLSHRGTTQPFKLSQKLNEGITALSRREGVTLYMALLAAFQILLRRYTGMTDIVVGSNCAGRDQVETEKLIGFFVNTLVLRTDLSGNPSFREMLARARDVALAAYAHQDLPFEKLVEELRPQRNLSHHPMFQVAFVMHHSAQEVVLPGLTLTPLELDNGTSKFDLTLAIKSAPDNENLFGFIEYSTDLFEQSTILRMIGHFENVISAMIANIDERIDAFTLLNKAEAHQLLVEWNQTALRFVHDKPVHEFFEDQVEKAPEAVAIVFEDEGITYRELNWRANQLAHYLQERGVVPGALVGISLERSPEMLIAMLGILKAGCAYLPLDPSYPKDRLNLVLQDAKPALLLTRQEDWPAINQSRSENPAVRVHENDLAYVLYTSGSTGKPKGVQIPHRALSNHMQWMQAEFPLNADDRVVQRTSSGFDASVWEFFAPLLAGACLVIPPPAEQWDAAELVRVIQLRKVTVLQVVPSLLRILLDETGLQNCPTLRRVFSGGEPLTAGLRDRFLATHPAELCNLYGPTEACIDTTFFRCATGAGNGESVPIGRPIANTQLYVLDRLQLPVPIGVPGELHIGGNGLARGYLNRSDLTAEVFVPNPFSTKPGERLYRTGDLVRYRADGNLEFLGRIDRQVKLRGFRLELGEIEAILQNDPAVQQALVMLREDGTEDQRLVAYIVCKQGHTSSADQLKSLLLTRLPYYMIPSAFVFLEAFPLTPNGKVDRSALPAAIPDLTGSDAGYVAPRTSVEQVLAMIWEEVLKLNRIGVADNFFDAGGHSLLATQVTSRIRNILRIDLPVRKLFEAPTVERLSHAILADEKKPGQVEKIARIALKVAAMSDEEAGKILEEKKRHHHE